MLYIPKIGNQLNILTDNEAKDLVTIYFGEYFKSPRVKVPSKVKNSFLEGFFLKWRTAS